MLSEPQVNLRDAIRLCYGHAPCGIAYVHGQGWAVYDLRKGCGAERKPEFVYHKRGVLPIPLSEAAFEALRSLVNELTGENR